uniref:TSA: Wollemia nobilis Ref_Wollemi_Transcript_911_3688 transcribed RNA sequence n=1 Tax=Wollemia nobilis TaxID=56998 RepID=A0A0C9RQX6_9CONI
MQPNKGGPEAGAGAPVRRPPQSSSSFQQYPWPGSTSVMASRPHPAGSTQSVRPEQVQHPMFSGQPAYSTGASLQRPSLTLSSSNPLQRPEQGVAPPTRPNGLALPFQPSQNLAPYTGGPPYFPQPPTGSPMTTRPMAPPLGSSTSQQFIPASGPRPPPVLPSPPGPLGPPRQVTNHMPTGGNTPLPPIQSSPQYPQGRLSSAPTSGPPMPQSFARPYPTGQGAQMPPFARPLFPTPESGTPSQQQHFPQSGGPQPLPGVAFQSPMHHSYMDGSNARAMPPYPTAAPPTGSIQGLAEEFQSLSVSSIPGSVEAGLDPNSLPRPLDETDIDITSSSTAYVSNCHPRFLRFTTNAIPISQSLLARWHLPLGAVVHPLAEPPDGEEIPVVDFGPSGIVRCRRCRTYINPYVTFTDGGRRWRCNVCTLLNEVSGEYFAPLDINGRRQDADQRPELRQGSVEFVAPTEYMVRPPMPPLYFFLIDVSQSAVRSGILQVAVETIKSCLDKLPGFPRTQIGFLTFDSALHFYNLKSSLTQPQMMVVADLDDPFVPLPDDLLVNLSESRHVVEALLDSLPSMFEENLNVESAFGPALKAAFMVMSQLGGKLLIFQSTLPSLGIGRLKLRGDDPRIYGTDKEHTIRIAEDPFYKQMAADLTKYQIGVNLYVFNDKYTDIASLGTLSKYTGGQVSYYPSCNVTLYKEKFMHELARDLTRETAWEAVMRIRCGKGVRFTTYHGHFMLRSSDLLALPAVDCDKGFAMQLSLEDTLLTTQTVYFQVALLYTSSLGERRIRVHTMAVPVVADLGEMYRNADAGSIISLLSRLAIEKTLSHKLEDARHAIQLRIVRSLQEYRNLYAVQHRLAGRLIFPESLKFLPLYGLGLCKSLALRGGYADAQIDERCAAGFNMMIIPIKRLLKLLYPSLVRLDEYLQKGSINVGDENKHLLQPLALSADKLDPRGAFLYDDGFRFVLWLGKVLSADFVANMLGVEAASTPDLSKVPVVEHNNELSKKFLATLKALREKDPAFYQHCYLVRQGEQPRESSLLLFNLVEDQISGTSGYVEWLLQIHRQVQQKGK